MREKRLFSLLLQAPFSAFPLFFPAREFRECGEKEKKRQKSRKTEFLKASLFRKHTFYVLDLNSLKRVDTTI